MNRVLWGTGVIATSVAVGCGSGSTTSTSSSPSVERTPPPAHRSGGAQALVKVPEIVGERYGRAVHKVHEAGLQQHAPGFTGTIGNPGYNGRCKKILSQSPPGGARLAKGGTVAIVYGVCPRAVANARHWLKNHS